MLEFSLVFHKEMNFMKTNVFIIFKLHGNEIKTQFFIFVLLREVITRISRTWTWNRITMMP